MSRTEPSQAPEPRYTSWEEYLAGSTASERRAWYTTKAKRANRPRLMSGAPEFYVTTDMVSDVVVSARGRCVHCGSLALEKRPSNAAGHPMPWEAVGRRIGSLGHIVPVVLGGTNQQANLTWECLWCNTWPDQRIPGATDRGGIQDGSMPAASGPKPPMTPQEIEAFLAMLRREAGDDDEGGQDWHHTDRLDADYWSEVVDPDDSDYLWGTAMRHND